MVVVIEQFDQWEDLQVFLPRNWLELAHSSGALKGLRKDKSPANFLRVMLIHFACGCSLRETAQRAQQSGLFSGSDVALMGRIIKAKEWLRSMCEEMFFERGVDFGLESPRLRIIDATIIHEPGRTGSQWRIHYGTTMPELRCDHFSITPHKGKGTGESLCHFPIHEGDMLLADRAYCRVKDIAYAHQKGAFIAVRLNYTSLPLWNADEGKRPFQLVPNLRKLTREGATASWNVKVYDHATDSFIHGRLCAIRKSPEAIQKAHAKCREKAQKNKQQVREKTLFVNQYVLVFTTFPKETFPLAKVLELYRLRWQIELIFKRFKSLAKLGHLPKYLEASAHAWLYGKLFVALLVEKLIAAGSAFSPWSDAPADSEELLARICLYVAGGDFDSSPSLSAADDPL